jgi:hypothetical protein
MALHCEPPKGRPVRSKSAVNHLGARQWVLGQEHAKVAASQPLKNLRKRHGGKRWRKLKGDATVRLVNGVVRRAEIHWYEAHGVGKRGLKIKRFLD